ncbi:inactive homolog of metal-dependent protease, putative molecular chaperone [Serpentinimonas raichei]|uniref:Inactive homolog of metal-dependent protease, putative molecular chaperone n=1 Tax=Serpentinimonas raichei TaxID=1458425 RepID=A0A060NIU5_9BURK|nr:MULTISPECIES: tRNA (adenosine(37)-N6)-threonylcarbamoyltransferase complex dimerization subunit type 1 TsaB [Serpentinimonas]BAO82096.1 inactive homolog of metal-dependent protease, putative molecular chaperone [Serpentinimonas raichei]
MNPPSYTSPACPPRPAARRVLAIETSTERLSVALGPAGGAALAAYEGEGGAQASATLLPRLLELLQGLGWRLAELDAIAFGQGPGAFTGLRSACAVVQGLALAARPGGVPVLPISTLLALGDEGWHTGCARGLWSGAVPRALLGQGQARPTRLVAALDARMGELYVAELRWRGGSAGDAGWRLEGAPRLCAPEALPLEWLQDEAGAATWLVSNALETYAERLPLPWRTAPQVPAWPSAAALLRLAGWHWAAGLAVAAEQAQPLYVRDQVALTTAERAALQAQRLAAQPGPP